jgi:hypothetical protein
MLVLDFTEHPVWRVQCFEKECTTPELKIKLLAKLLLLICFKKQINAFVTIKWYNVVIINVDVFKTVEDVCPKTLN